MKNIIENVKMCLGIMWEERYHIVFVTIIDTIMFMFTILCVAKPIAQMQSIVNDYLCTHYADAIDKLNII